MFHTITAKFPGTCKRCHGQIFKGDRIRYGGPGRIYHFAAACGLSAAAWRDDAASTRSTAPRDTIGDAFDRMLEDRADAITAEYGGDR